MVLYHQLVMGKPIGDVWIDDRALPFTNWESMNSILKEKIKK